MRNGHHHPAQDRTVRDFSAGRSLRVGAGNWLSDVLYVLCSQAGSCPQSLSVPGVSLYRPVIAETREREAAGTESGREHLDQELQRALSLVRLSQEIQASNQGRAALLQNSKKHLRQLLCQFKSLEVGVPRLRHGDTPKLHPLLLCVEAEPSLNLSHLDILTSISDVIPDPMTSGRVTKIQFQDLNVTFRTAGQHNRWLITCSDLQTQGQLLCSGLQVRVQGGGAVQLHCVQHDALVKREYEWGLRIARGRHRLMETLSLEGRTGPRGSTSVQPAEAAQKTFL